MTEAEWQVASVQAKLDYMRRCTLKQRKVGLLALGACRLVWHLLLDKRSQHAIEAMEEIWDASHTRHLPQRVIRAALRGSKWSSQFGTTAEIAADAVNQALNLYPISQIGLVFTQVNVALTASGLQTSNDLLISPLLGDIFGNPFRPVTLDPSWLTSTVVALARQMYDSRDFSAMPILADALEDAGCDNGDILNHCRGEGVHVRGCLVVDLLLGKE